MNIMSVFYRHIDMPEEIITIYQFWGIATKMFGCICLMKNGKKLFQSITIEEIN